MNLELYPLKIFCQVMTDRTFSGAARNLRISQPTISQQIAKLEGTLSTKLFQRVGTEIVPTSSARELYQFASHLLEQVSHFEERVAQDHTAPRGLVRYSMPESCQWTPHYRRIMAQIAEFPEVQFQIGIQPNEQIVKGLLEGELDFGFVCGERLSPELRFEKFSDERYVAVASTKRLLSPLLDGDPKQLRLITYPGWELFFTTWAKGMGLWNRFKSHEPTIRIGTLAGAIHAAQEGAGVAIIPTHCVFDELKTGDLIAFQKKGADPLNPVYLARRVGEKLPRRVELVIGMLRTAKAEIG